ncbi:HWE histidine kinase domain-containing protein [Roseovarius sp.]|uniref:HWE histidine kinase domain-containing protein n=1 Tax=Roseovarius sp. TaxID=1486281 RepID=UPI003D0FBBD1
MTRDLETPLNIPLTSDDVELGLRVARVGLGKVDYRADTLRCDSLAAEFFGLDAGVEVPRSELHARIHPDDWPQVQEGLECLLSPENPLQVLDMTHRILVPDVPLRWVNARKQVTYDAEGLPVEGVFAMIDITAQEMAERRAQFLIGELGHRAKNLITVVSGIVRQLARHSPPEEIADRLLARLAALGRNQEAMMHDAGSRFGLREIFTEQVRPFSGAARERMVLDGPDLMISSNAAQILGMVTHELATNAAKYGALSEEGGRVVVTWTVTGDESPDFALEWVERGGPKVTETKAPGFGTQVLTKLTEGALGAKTDVAFDTEGLVFRLRAPLSALSRE